MRKIMARRFGRKCEHPHNLVVTSVGVRRTICENCGHISFKLLDTQPKVSYGYTAEVRGELPHAEGL